MVKARGKNDNVATTETTTLRVDSMSQSENSETKASSEWKKRVYSAFPVKTVLREKERELDQWNGV